MQLTVIRYHTIESVVLYAVDVQTRILAINVSIVNLILMVALPCAGPTWQEHCS